MSKPLEESSQYSDQSVYRYEVIFGKDFISTGGLESTQELCATLGLAPGQTVLDVGSGVGGSAFYMAETYGVAVHGVDLLGGLVEQANQRAVERGLEKVRFTQGDIMTADIPEGAYDLVYSRDALLYIEDKLGLYQRLRRFLKPGGQLFVTDYSCGPEPLADDFTAYAAEAGYYLHPPAGYGNVLQEAGYDDVVAEDRTADFIAIMAREMKRVEEVCSGPEPALTAEDQGYLLSRWARKIDWCRAGHMRWAHLRARA
ncbi:MAG: hypothetical protein RLZZ303_2927 [Candidatus Hydrogenedentota bacterium]|jgi:phosphoethanolamine N-methyltransferase